MKHSTRVGFVAALITALFITGCNIGSIHDTFAQGNTVTQGASIMGVDAWHEAGFTGEDVKVGIWDFGFLGYEGLLGSDLPPADRLTARGFGIEIEGDPADIEADPEGPRAKTAHLPAAQVKLKKEDACCKS